MGLPGRIGSLTNDDIFSPSDILLMQNNCLILLLVVSLKSFYFSFTFTYLDHF